MKITFFSNFMNHHQLPFCLEMSKMPDIDFRFVATEPIEQERLKLGYVDMNKMYDFVVRSYDDEDLAQYLADNSEVVIIGSAPRKYIEKRLKQKKITFRYSERVFKGGFSIRTYFSLFKNYGIRERHVYLLCASAYAAYDYNRAFCFNNRAYKWGYFPETYEYDIQKVLAQKAKNKKIELLWVARFLELKHPEYAILLAQKLNELQIDFNLTMIGIGEKIEEIKGLVKEKNLTSKVKFIGAVNYKEVRKYMEKANIFIFNSDFNEGWGAVINEAMNSGCTVIASHAIGSVPFIIKNDYNGIIYENGNIDDFLKKACDIVCDRKKQYEIGNNAYQTMISTWNAKKAANNLIKLIKSISEKKDNPILDGPCSKALPISNKKMYNYLLRSRDD